MTSTEPKQVNPNRVRPVLSIPGTRRSRLSGADYVSNCSECTHAIYAWEAYEWRRGEYVGLCHVKCPDRTTPLIRTTIPISSPQKDFEE
jgi:hypothetical protein